MDAPLSVVRAERVVDDITPIAILAATGDIVRSGHDMEVVAIRRLADGAGLTEPHITSTSIESKCRNSEGTRPSKYGKVRAWRT